MNTNKIVALIALIAFVAPAWGSFHESMSDPQDNLNQEVKKGNLNYISYWTQQGGKLEKVPQSWLCNICKKNSKSDGTRLSPNLKEHNKDAQNDLNNVTSEGLLSFMTTSIKRGARLEDVPQSDLCNFCNNMTCQTNRCNN